MSGKYFGTVRDRFGAVVRGAVVTVLVSATKELASLVDRNGNAIANPMTTRDDGHYGFNCEPDLYDVVVDGQVEKNVYVGAKVLDVIHMSNDVCIVSGDDVPTDDVTGADLCGPGSQYIDYTNANMYINAGTKAEPTWKLVTRAS